MKNTFGTVLTVTLFGESHGPAIGAVVDGLAPGIRIDEEYIAARMDQRRAVGTISTGRREADEVKILSGVFNGYTTGTPLTVLIENQDTRSKDYSAAKDLARPAHADYTANVKYGGYQDYRGGGHFSGRLTAPLVAAGAIVMKALEDKGIRIGTHIASCHGICDRKLGALEAGERAASDTYEKQMERYNADIDWLGRAAFPVLDGKAAAAIRSEIEMAAQAGDSVGGVLETAVTGLPAGLGEPWFDTVESLLAHGIFAIPAVKGVEFGAGFAVADLYGSEANDAFRMNEGRVVTATNTSGGINGGITNGMPLTFRTAVKPTPSIYKTQQTVNLATGQNADLTIQGRHDPAIIHRARVVVDAVTTLVLADLLTLRYGTDYLKGEA